MKMDSLILMKSKKKLEYRMGPLDPNMWRTPRVTRSRRDFREPGLAAAAFHPLNTGSVIGAHYICDKTLSQNSNLQLAKVRIRHLEGHTEPFLTTGKGQRE